MTAFLSMGIDPSTSATGLVMLVASDSGDPDLAMEKEIKYPKLSGLEQKIAIVTDVMQLIHSHAPDRIVVEGYSLNMKNASSVVPLVELGGILRFLMKLDGMRWYDPRATEVKKFVTGKGNVNKDVVMMHVLKRWNHTSLSNNTADAYGLAAMGLAHANRLHSVTLDMRAVTGKMEERCN